MKVGFIGDVVGSLGRDELRKYAKKYKEKFELDFLVANCENASGGFGLSAKNAIEIFSYGIDAITGGNHSFDKKDILALMQEFPIIRPFNHYDGTPGKGIVNLKKDNESLSVINLMGAIGVNLCDNIFHSLPKALELCESKNILVDLHSEMTSEKNAFFWEFKGKLSAILGTHTHVGTDDLRVDKGTAYVSDVGLCGAREGVIGMDGDASVEVFKTGLKRAFFVNENYKRIFQMVVLDIIDGKTKEAFKFRLIDNKEYFQEAIYE